MKLDDLPQGGECPFDRGEIESRQAALQRTLRNEGVDLYLTSSPENIYYLSGQQTPGYYTFQCLAVPADGSPFLMIRALETWNARINSYVGDIISYADEEDPAAFVASSLKARGWHSKRVAIDMNARFLNVALYQRLTAAFQPLLNGAGWVEPLRRIKSNTEIAYIEQAAAANDAGMSAALDTVVAGASDNDLAAAAMDASIRAGGEYVGMEPLLGTGARAGIPHTTWRREPIQTGDVVIVETAACWNRYHAALYRTVFVGDVPKHASDYYAVCEEGLEAALSTLKPGAACRDVHNAAQAVIDRHGMTDGFRKRAGYSMGLSFAPDWGEGDILSLHAAERTIVEPGMVFHIPITLRDYGVFTVAVSETAVVTDTGNRTLSSQPRSLHLRS